MAGVKVDKVHYHYNKTSGKLEVWCFNDDKAYSEKYRKRAAKYDFDRKPKDEEGNPTDRKQKLLVGLYREPYQDGWKYTVSEKVLPMLVETVFRMSSIAVISASSSSFITFSSFNSRALVWISVLDILGSSFVFPVRKR